MLGAELSALVVPAAAEVAGASEASLEVESLVSVGGSGIDESKALALAAVSELVLVVDAALDVVEGSVDTAVVVAVEGAAGSEVLDVVELDVTSASARGLAVGSPQPTSVTSGAEQWKPKAVRRESLE